MDPADSHRRFSDLITVSSVGGMVEDDPDGDVAGSDAFVTGFNVFTDLAASRDLDAFADFDSLTGPDSDPCQPTDEAGKAETRRHRRPTG